MALWYFILWKWPMKVKIYHVTNSVRQLLSTAVPRSFVVFVTAEIQGIYSFWFACSLTAVYSCARKRNSARFAKRHKEYNALLVLWRQSTNMYGVKTPYSVPSYDTTATLRIRPEIAVNKHWRCVWFDPSPHTHTHTRARARARVKPPPPPPSIVLTSRSAQDNLWIEIPHRIIRQHDIAPPLLAAIRQRLK
jgi:hypothetical protein